MRHALVSLFERMSERMGPRALEALRTAMGDADASVRYRAAHCLLLRDPSDEASLAVLKSLVLEGASGVEDQAVQTYLRYAEVADQAVLSRCLMGIEDPDWAARHRYIGALGLAKAPAKWCQARLVVLLETDSSAPVREACVFALAELQGSDPFVVVPALVDATHDASEHVRQRATASLGSYCEANASRIPEAIASLEDEDPEVRLRAAKLLSAFGAAVSESEAESVDKVARLLQDPSREVRPWAACILAKVGPPSITALPQLVSSLTDSDPELVTWAIYAIGCIGPAARDAAIGPLIERTTDDSLEIVREAVTALGRVARDAPEQEAQRASHALVQALSSKDLETRTRAIEALDQIDSVSTSER